MARLSLRLVIGGLCAFIVVISAAVTLLITYTVALSTARDIGTRYATSLATNARDQTTSYFSLPIAQCNSTSRQYQQSDWWYTAPTSDPDIVTPDRVHLKYWNLHYQIMATADFEYASTTTMFADGSNHNVDKLGDVMIMVSRLAINYPAQDMNLKVFAMNMTTGQMLDPKLVIPNYNLIAANYDYREWPAWPSVISIYTALGNSLTYALPAIIGNRVMRLGGKPSLFIPFSGAFIDPTTKKAVGQLGLSRELASIGLFLKSVKAQATPNMQAFAIDGNGFIAGSSTGDDGFTTYVQADNISRALAENCLSDSDGRFDKSQPITVACRTYARNFASYSPLQSVGQSSPDFLLSKTSIVTSFDFGGTTYFVASMPVPLYARSWNMNIVVFMPEDDVIGSIITGRNTAIGATAGVCVLAALISFVSVAALLRPIRSVSQKMLATAKLKEADKESGSESNLSEIQDLQRAYTNMSAAITSFTRYVPRDVVKDLMRSGQLCEIKMEQRYCTMLFVDIAGFTTVCERVPPDTLSFLVTQYFDRASRIVMSQDGLIDKFIGDCIMAVWGAPFALPNQEVKAVLAGKLIDRETTVQPLASQWDEAGEQLRVRVGISSGIVLAGNMGSDDRMSYTVIGDPVNLAARLESMNKQFGTRVMVSEMTAQALGNIFVLRLLMPIAVVGKAEPVKVYEVVGLQPQLDQYEAERLNAGETRVDEDTGSSMGGSGAGMVRTSTANTANLIREALLKTAQNAPVACTEAEIQASNTYTEAVHAYLRRDFSGAINIILKMRATAPAHLLGQSLNMLEQLCEQLLMHCPANFDGVYHAEHK